MDGLPNNFVEDWVRALRDEELQEVSELIDSFGSDVSQLEAHKMLIELCEHVVDVAPDEIPDGGLLLLQLGVLKEMRGRVVTIIYMKQIQRGHAHARALQDLVGDGL